MTSEEQRSINRKFLEAAANGNIIELRELLSQGADINTVNFDGHSALHRAVTWVRLDCIEFLVEQGIDCSMNRPGFTALEQAISNGDHLIVDYLAKHQKAVEECQALEKTIVIGETGEGFAF